MSGDLSGQAVRPLQLICTGLILGLVLFSTVVIFLSLSGAMQPAAGTEMVAWILLALSLPQIVATQIVSSRLQPAGKLDREALLSSYRTSSIVGWAGLEGAAFMNIVGFLIAGNWLSLLIPGVVLCWLAATFPTADRLDNWLRQQEIQYG